MSPTERDQDNDPYAEIARGMTPGLLVTFNQSTPTQAGTDELEVTLVDEDRPLVELKDSREQYYQFYLTAEDEMEFCEVNNEGEQSKWTSVETIEVIGVAG